MTLADFPGMDTNLILGRTSTQIYLESKNAPNLILNNSFSFNSRCKNKLILQ